MSYKLGQQNQVQHVESGAWIPARWEAGKVVALDEYSPFVKDFQAWTAAGNTPTAADPLPAVAAPDPVVTLSQLQSALAAAGLSEVSVDAAVTAVKASATPA